MNEPGTTRTEFARVHVDVPAQTRFVRTVRLLLGDAAARAGFSFDEIEDLRLAVTELCNGILAPNATVLSIDIGFEPGRISVDGRVDAPGGHADMDAVITFVIDVICDRCTVDTSGETASFSFEKRSRR